MNNTKKQSGIILMPLARLKERLQSEMNDFGLDKIVDKWKVHLPEKLNSKTKSLVSIRDKENYLLLSLLALQLHWKKLQPQVTKLMKRHLKKQI